MRIVFAIAATLGLLAVPAAAQVRSVENGLAGSRAPANADQSQLVCINQEVTGSRLETTRICHSRDEWKRMRRRAANVMPLEQTRSTGCTSVSIC